MVTKALPPEPAIPDNLPQQFMRVANEPASKGTCARTDLVYIHPPPEERKAMTSTIKVLVTSTVHTAHVYYGCSHWSGFIELQFLPVIQCTKTSTCKCMQESILSSFDHSVLQMHI